MTEEPAVTLRRVFKAPRPRVFRAWTEARELERWFGPRGWSARVARLDLRVGGEYEFAMTPAEPDRGRRSLAGRFREVRTDRRLVFTWVWKDGPDAEANSEESLVTIDFRDVEAGTEVVLKHERLLSEASREGHRGGWRESFDRLVEHVAGGGR